MPNGKVSVEESQEEPLAYKDALHPTAGEKELDGLLADWVGEDAAPGVLGALHRRPRSIASLVDEQLGRLRADDSALLERIGGSWSELVGAETSRHLTPLEIKGDTLVISAANQTYLFVFQQPQMREPILRNLSDFTNGRIQKCRFVSPGRR